MRSLVGSFLPLFSIVDRETTNGLMPGGGKHMMLSRPLIVPGEEHAVVFTGVDLCFFVMILRGSMVLQGRHIMNALGRLWSTPPVHIIGERHLIKGSLWCEAVYSCSQGAWRWFGGGSC